MKFLRSILMTVSVLVLLACTVPAQAANPPPAEKATAPANLQLAPADLDNLNAVLSVARDVDREIANADLTMKAARARSEAIQARAEVLRLRILVARNLDPDKYEVLIVPIKPTEANGNTTAEWAIRPKPPKDVAASPPSTNAKPPEAKNP